ncbi:Lytic transglycosylase-like, catalytic domain protein [Candidatus Magnetoovum chiemensis]|nr:Lytic transglycosylase-like, catalytic domain protein [Candidatus Magnetoovum chiemensis]
MIERINKHALEILKPQQINGLDHSNDFREVLSKSFSKSSEPTSLDIKVASFLNQVMEDVLKATISDEGNNFPQLGNYFPSLGSSSLSLYANMSLQSLSKNQQYDKKPLDSSSESLTNSEAVKANAQSPIAFSPSSSKESTAYTSDYEDMVKSAASEYSVDPELIHAVIMVESGGNSEAVSRCGAKGLMQLMPATAKDLGVRNSLDPKENIMGGTKYLSQLIKRYDGDTRRALAAYNWGMGNVEKNPNRMPKETKNYIAKVEKIYAQRMSKDMDNYIARSEDLLSA